MKKKTIQFIAAGLVMMLFGITMVVVGTINNYITIRFQVDKFFIGFCASVLATGILTGSFTFGPVAERYGYKPVMLGGVFLVILGIWGITQTETVGYVPYMFFTIGMGGGSVNGVTNMLVADVYPENNSAYLSLLGVFYGIGALSFPLLTSLLLEMKLDYQAILTFVAFILFIPFILVLFTNFPETKKAKTILIRQYFNFFSKPLILSIGMFLFFESAIEAIIPAWTPTYLMEVFEISYDKGLYAITVSAIGITVTRIFLSQLLKRLSPITVLFFSMATVMAGAIVLQFSTSWLMGIAGIAIIGVGMASFFPVMLGYTASAFPENSGTAFSIVLGISLIGNILLSSLTGWVLEIFGIRLLNLLIMAFVLIMTGILSMVKHKILKV